MSVNSVAVLRLTGRGSGPIAGAARGRSTSRGRGENLITFPGPFSGHVVAVWLWIGLILDHLGSLSLNN